MSALLLAAAALTPAVGAQVYYSSDAEDSEVVKAAIDFDLRYVGPEHRLGVSVERARYRPLGTDARTMARVFLRASDSISGWKWDAKSLWSGSPERSRWMEHWKLLQDFGSAAPLSRFNP